MPGLVRILEEGQRAQNRAVPVRPFRRHLNVLRREQPRAHIRHHLGDVALLLRRHAADIVFGVKRPGDLRAQERADRLAANPAHDLAQQIALIMDVIGRPGAGLPQGLLILQRLHIGLAVEHAAGIQPVVGEHRNSGGVIEDMTDEDPVLAVLREFRPVGRDRRIDIDLAAVDQHVEADAGDALGDRHHADRGMGVPRLGLVAVAIAAPQIDHRLAVDDHRNGRTRLVLDPVILLEGLEHRLKARITLPPNWKRRPPRLDQLIHLHRKVSLELL